MQHLDEATRTELEAAAFRRLLRHLDDNKDVQNIDLMILADFCRNCLSKWLVAAAEERLEEFLAQLCGRQRIDMVCDGVVRHVDGRVAQ